MNRRTPRRATIAAGPRGEPGACEWTGELFGDERLRCAVPFCNRSVERAAIAPHTEWICGKHWSAVSPLTRHRYAQAKRIAKRRLGQDGYDRAIARVHAIWQRCKMIAYEKAGGI